MWVCAGISAVVNTTSEAPPKSALFLPGPCPKINLFFKLGGVTPFTVIPSQSNHPGGGINTPAAFLFAAV